jgi:hypothetical protein
MLRIAELDKMLTDLTNSKQSRQLSVASMEILVCGYNHNVLNSLFSICISECLVII